MSTPVTDDERARIVELMQAGHSRSQIATETGRGKSTITRIANEIGHDWLTTADARTQSTLARAHEARSAYTAEARAKAAERAQERMQEILDSFMDERTVMVPTRDGIERVLAPPDAKAIRDLASAVHTLQRTVLDIDRHDNRAEDGLSAVDQWLRGLIGEETAA